jgi:transcriptional regulator with XRE-family HTH domain
MFSISATQAQGRLIAAARIFAGLDQAQLASLAGVSASTVSNVEKGRIATPDSLKALRRALKDQGVNMTFGNHQASASIAFVDRNSEDE